MAVTLTITTTLTDAQVAILSDHYGGPSGPGIDGEWDDGDLMNLKSGLADALNATFRTEYGEALISENGYPDLQFEPNP